MVDRVDLAAGVEVLDRAAYGSCLRSPYDGRRGGFGVGPVAVLEIDGDGQARRSIEQPHVRDHVVEGGAAVPAAQREREARARARERLEAERLENPGRAGVPRVRDDEGLALVQGAKVRRLPLLRRWHVYP